MTPRAPSPPLIKGIDGIVSMHPNELNYSTFNGKRMESGKQPGKEIRQKYRKHRISGNMATYVKQEENVRKIGNLMEPGNRNKIKVMKMDVESNGEDDGATSEPKQQKCDSKPLTDTTNDNICSNHCTSASRKIENNKNNNNDNKDGGKEVTNMNNVTTNDGRNEEVPEAKVNSKNSISSNSGIVRSNSKSNYVEPKIWKRLDKIENKMIVNNVGHDRENPCETRESQQ